MDGLSVPRINLVYRNNPRTSPGLFPVPMPLFSKVSTRTYESGDSDYQSECFPQALETALHRLVRIVCGPVRKLAGFRARLPILSDAFLGQQFCIIWERSVSGFEAMSEPAKISGLHENRRFVDPLFFESDFKYLIATFGDSIDLEPGLRLRMD
jgi:hypothetical protein